MRRAKVAVKKTNPLRFTTVKLIEDGKGKLKTRVSIGIKIDVSLTLSKVRHREKPGDHFIHLKSFEIKEGSSFNLFESSLNGRNQPAIKEIKTSAETKKVLVTEKMIFRLRLGQMLAFNYRGQVVYIGNFLTDKGSIIETFILNKNEILPNQVILALSYLNPSPNTVEASEVYKGAQIIVGEEWSPSQSLVAS